MDAEITTPRRKELAAALGVNDQYLYQCLTGRRDMGPIEAQRVERESHGEITRRMVCQKTYAAIWPELAAARVQAAAARGGLDTPEPAKHEG